MKKYRDYFITCLISLSILLFVFYTLKIYPFGESTLLMGDMQNQYAEFMKGIPDLFNGKNNLFYSLNIGLGYSYLPLFMYYISSPILLIYTLLFGTSNILLTVSVLTQFKIVVSSMTMLFYLNHHTLPKSVHIPFSIGYAFLSFTLSYSQCLMWIDAIILLPLVIYSIDLVLRKEQWIPLTIFICLLLFSNFYLGAMVCAFSVLYIIEQLFLNEIKLNLKTAINLIKGYFLGVLPVSFLLIPTFLSIMENRGSNSFDIHSAFTLSNLLGFFNIFIGQAQGYTNSANPYLYCGLFTIILFLCIFISKKVKLRSKIIYGVFILFWILCLCYDPLYYAWHLLQSPAWFPTRFAFLIPFTLIVMVVENIDALQKEKMIIPFISIFLILFYFYGKSLSLNYPFNYTKINILFLILYSLLFFIKDKRIQFVLFILISSIEITINTKSYFEFSLDNGMNATDYFTYEETINSLLSYIPETDKFYRVENDEPKSLNEPIGYGYYGITHYSSTYNKDMNHFYKSLGMGQTHFWSAYRGSTPLLDSLFNIKYIITTRLYPKEYNYITTVGEYNLYENPFVFNKQFTPEDIYSYAFTKDIHIENQNEIYQQLSGTKENILTKFEDFHYEFNQTKQDSIDPPQFSWTEDVYYKPTVSIIFNVEDENPLYLYIPSSQGIEARISINYNELDHILYVGNENPTIYLGNYEKGEEVRVDIELYESPTTFDELTIYKFDMSKMESLSHLYQEDNQ